MSSTHEKIGWCGVERDRSRGDRIPREFEQAGKPFSCGKAKCNMKEQGGQEAEEEMRKRGPAMRSTWVDVLVGKEDGGSEVT
jgi:hypothetical protein